MRARRQARPELFCCDISRDARSSSARFAFQDRVEAEMSKAKSKTDAARPKRRGGAGGKSRKPVDLEAVRHEITELVGSQAMGMIEVTIGEVDKGHYGAMKYLFEMIGLYPATGEEAPVAEDSLAKTLLKRLGLPEDSVLTPEITKDCAQDAAGDDAVK
jgi:hypothetical protein